MEQHHNIRSAVVCFMKEKWSKQRKRIVGKDFEQYLTTFRMDEEETWATENEIFAKIMVFTKCTQGYKWV
jgi:hypothetical protein